jgi:HD superfamily phosphohydrolase
MPEKRHRNGAPADAPRKTVHDPVHGSLDIGGVFLELLDSPELQRLHGIHQLGLAELVFPGANHTRLEHSLGVWHIGTMMAEHMGIREGRDELSAACFLHDVGHAPYSHTLEYILQDVLGTDHMELTRSIITGKYDVLGPYESMRDRRRIPEILEDSGLDVAQVAGYVAGEPGLRPDSVLEQFAPKGQKQPGGFAHLGQLLHGALDADQLDYLLRDAHYTGVAYGVIDLSRLLGTMAFHDGRLVVHKSGLVAVESMLVARALMYSSVYFHRTVRICEMMLARAVERMEGLGGLDLPRMTDCELMHHLAGAGKYQRDIALRLKYRRLFKRAYSLPASGLDEDRAAGLARLDDPTVRQSVEDEIARRAGVEEGYVIVDLPSKEVILSEPRMHKTDVLILDEERGKLQPLSKHSPLARALQFRRVPDWAVMVSTDAGMRSKVAAAAKRVLA